MNIPVLATGLSGLVGTRVKEILDNQFDFEDLSLATGIDIANQSLLESAFARSDAQVVLHMAAKTDVDGCEDDKVLGEEGGAWQVNVIGTQNVIEAARKTGKRIVYISTDFVFDGNQDKYKEDDEPNPLSWYGYTKYLGEEELRKSDLDYSIVRISYPYRNQNDVKDDFVHRIIKVMLKNKKCFGLIDHIFTPTFIDDIARGLSLFLSRSLPGIYHLVGSGSLKTIDAVKLISGIFGIEAEIEPITREVYFKNKAFRPFKLALSNDKILKLGLKMLTFEEGLKTVKKQES